MWIDKLKDPLPLGDFEGGKGSSAVKVHGAYVLRHRATDAVYIGSSGDVRRRLIAHKGELARGRHGSKKLQELYLKDPAVEISKVVVAGNREEAYDVEQQLIDEAIAADCKLLNVSTDARSPGAGHAVSQAHREKLRQLWTGTKASDETRKKLTEASKGRMKEVTADGVSFQSIADAARHHGIGETTVNDRCRSKSPRFEGWSCK